MFYSSQQYYYILGASDVSQLVISHQAECHPSVSHSVFKVSHQPVSKAVISQSDSQSVKSDSQSVRQSDSESVISQSGSQTVSHQASVSQSVGLKRIFRFIGVNRGFGS